MTRIASTLGVAFLAACSSGPADEEIAAAVESAFSSANPSGRTGLLMKGRTGVVWWQTGAFTPACLENNDLAFNDDPTTRPASARGAARISPTYQKQWGVTAATDTGYCIDLGSDPQISVGDVSPSGEGYRVVATITMAQPTKWFECLRSDLRDRVVEISVDAEGMPVVDTDMSLLQGDCPANIPASAARAAKPMPTAEAPSAPTAAQLQQLAADFDAALASRDGQKARDLIACYNLFEASPYYDACALSEIIPHGSVVADEANPWLEYAIKDFTELQQASQDRDIPNMYHVTFRHRRSGDRKSISVQWVDGEWKLVGIVSRKSPGLTVARILNDLHDRDKRDIFRRRMAGEDIDETGQPNNPQEEEEASSGGEIRF